jgi:negative regulator of sigma E activity
VFKIGMGFPEARPYVAEGLASPTADVVGHHVAGATDAVLTTNHDQIVSGRDAYCLGERRIAVKLCGIETAD